MDTIAAGSVLRSHGPYPYLAINRLYTLILGQPPSCIGDRTRNLLSLYVALQLDNLATSELTLPGYRAIFVDQVNPQELSKRQLLPTVCLRPL